MPSKIVSGDTVMVIAGSHKGKRGEVAQVLRDQSRVIVRGVNMVKRHTKPTQQSPQGGIVDKEAPLHISNVMLIDPQDGRPTRVGFKQSDSGWIRVSRRTDTEIPFPTK